MSRPRRRRARAGTGVLSNLVAGGYGPLERIRVIGRNVWRRGWFGPRPHACCGNYGEPGC